MSKITINVANIIERALCNIDGSANYWTSKVTPELVRLLKESGLRHVGFEPSSINPESEPRFWGVWKIVDRAVAELAVLPFRKALANIDFVLTPFDQTSHWAEYLCPKCHSTDIRWTDGDSVGVPVLPEGIASYDDIDTCLMVGECQQCHESLYFYEFGFSSIANPDDDQQFCVSNLPQTPDKFQMYTAQADGLIPWIVSRLWFTTGTLKDHYNTDVKRLPKGPFVVDFHQFGPFSLNYKGKLSGIYGVSRCASGSNNEWSQGEDLFRNIAKNAQDKVLEAAKEI